MIRTIQQKDVSAIARICEEALGHRASTEVIARRIGELATDSAYYIVAFESESDHEVKGFLQAEKYDLLYGEKGWNIIALAVVPEAQGQGVGKALLTALEQYAEKSEAAFVRLNSRVERTNAHAFYEHLGYHCDKVQKRFLKHIGE